jgi:sugar/nucleoside kinase (ribokinase family)
MAMNSPKQLDVIVAGLALADIIGRPIDLRKPPRRGALKLVDSITLTTGGNVSNVGIDLSKLGFRVGAITRIGDDALGRFVLQHCRTFGMNTEGVSIDRGTQTSATIVSVDNDGERTFVHTRGCMERFRASDLLTRMPYLRRAKILAFGYLGLLPETEKDFARLFSTIKAKTSLRILLDTAAAPRITMKMVRSFIPYIDYFIPSYEEAVLITGKKTPEEIVDTLQIAGAPHVVGVKLGKRGCYLSDGTRSEYVRAIPVRSVVDATGAGDAFIAGFVAGTLRGYDPFRAALVANKIAASCVRAVGASTAIRRFETYR